MAFATADLERIDAAIASGIKKVTFEDGRSREYQSLDQMLAARRVIEAQIRQAESAQSGVVRRRLVSWRRGV